MAQIVESLKGILVRALPTFFLVIALHWYLKKVLIQPMERVLAERRKRTAGAVEASERSLARAAETMQAYETALYHARADIYAEQEANRRALVADRNAELDQTRRKTAAQVAAARVEIAAEADAARVGLASDSDRLAEQIASALLAGGN